MNLYLSTSFSDEIDPEKDKLDDTSSYEETTATSELSFDIISVSLTDVSEESSLVASVFSSGSLGKKTGPLGTLIIMS